MQKIKTTITTKKTFKKHRSKKKESKDFFLFKKTLNK